MKAALASDAEDNNHAITVLAWGLTAVSICLSAWGWLNDGVTVMTVFFTAAFSLFQLGTNKGGEWARKLGAARPVSALGALVLMVVCGLFCHESLKLAWTDAGKAGLVEQSLLTDALLLVLPFAEPLVFWLKRQLTEVRDTARAEREKAEAADLARVRAEAAEADRLAAERRAADRRAAEAADAAASLAEQPASQAPRRARPASGRKIARAVGRAAASAPVLMAGQALAEPPPLVEAAPAEDPGAAYSAAQAEEMAINLLAAGTAVREVARRTGLSRYRAGKLAEQVAAQRAAAGEDADVPLAGRLAA